MTKKALPDCLSCGICCVSLQEQDSYCDLTEEDIARLPQQWIKRNVIPFRPFDLLCAAIDGCSSATVGAIKTKWRKQRAGPFKGRAACVCTALRGSICHKVSCSIYENRPWACRNAVVPGDRACKEARLLFKTEAARIQEAKA